MVQGDSVIKSATSLLDYVFRNLGFEYLGRDDFIHVKNSPLKTETPIIQSVIKTAIPKKDDSKVNSAKAQGYTGETCGTCGSMRLRQNGTCSICDDCGSTTGCS